MNSTAVSDHTAAGGSEGALGVHMALEMIVLPVADAERSKRFYTGLGWRLDADLAPVEGFRVVQVTPTCSPASILFGEGVTSAEPGSIDTLLLVVEDVEAARAELLARGAPVSELFHGPGAGFRHASGGPRDAGRDPDGRSYVSWATFEDPDGNGWVLQEIKERLPGREWATDATSGVAGLADLLHETADHHDHYEKTHAPHDWWDWYAAYFDARRHGDGPDAAALAANHYMDEVKHIAAL